MLLKNHQVNEEIRKEMKKYLETNDKTQPYKIYGMKQKLFLEEVPSNEQVCSKTGLPQKNRKTSNKQPKLPPKRIRKEQNKDQRENK